MVGLYLFGILLHLVDVVFDGFQSVLEEILLLLDGLDLEPVVEHRIQLCVVHLLTVLLDGARLILAVDRRERRVLHQFSSADLVRVHFVNPLLASVRGRGGLSAVVPSHLASILVLVVLAGHVQHRGG